MLPSAQICVKPRDRSEESFFDLARVVILGTLEERSTAKIKLRDLLAAWIAEHEGVSSISELPQLDLNAILGQIKNRVCYVAGHVWIEYGQCGGGDKYPIHAAALRQPQLPLCGELSEFLPDVDELLEKASLPQHLLPDNFTPDVAWALVAKLFESGPNRQFGVVPGEQTTYPANEIEGMPAVWLQDRLGAKVSPKWKVATERLQTLKDRTPKTLLYSYAPDQHAGIHNCVTWATMFLDEVTGDKRWFQQYLHCIPDGRDYAGDEERIRQTGRVSFIEPYAERADTVRNSHPTFDEDDSDDKDSR